MGVLTALAIGGALAGGLFAGRKSGQFSQQQADKFKGTMGERIAQNNVAQAPPPAPAAMAPPTPPPSARRPEAFQAARAAGVRQRRRAAASNATGTAGTGVRVPGLGLTGGNPGGGKTLLGY